VFFLLPIDVLPRKIRSRSSRLLALPGKYDEPVHECRVGASVRVELYVHYIAGVCVCARSGSGLASRPVYLASRAVGVVWDLHGNRTVQHLHQIFVSLNVNLRLLATEKSILSVSFSLSASSRSGRRDGGVPQGIRSSTPQRQPGPAWPHARRRLGRFRL
jgi:hypothetical protein